MSATVETSAVGTDKSTVTAGPTPTVVGLDISLTGTGIASSAGWCDKVGRNGVTTLPLSERIRIIDELAARILELVANPRLVVVEQPPPSGRGTGASVERHALHWLVVRSLLRHEVPVVEVTTRGRMRYATGKGAATKEAVVDAVARRWPAWETGGDNNMCDAVVLMAMGRDASGAPLCPLPATHRAAMDAVAWPDLDLSEVAS